VKSMAVSREEPDRVGLPLDNELSARAESSISSDLGCIDNWLIFSSQCFSILVALNGAVRQARYLSVMYDPEIARRGCVLSAVDEKAVNQLNREQCVKLTGIVSALVDVTANDCLNGAAIPVWSGKRAFIKQHIAYIL